MGFDNFKTTGDVDIFWAPEGEKYYAIENGTLKFKLLEQEADVTKFKYNSKKKEISAEALDLKINIGGFKNNFEGKNIAINDDGIKFEELSTKASGHKFDMKVFSLEAEKYAIQKDDKGGLKVNAIGKLDLSLPDYLGIETKGEIKGSVGLNFKESVEPDYKITSGKAEVKMPNPLNKISEILGDDWSSSRYELSATIPVFPAVSAIFGIYIEYGAKLAKELAAVIELDEKSNAIKLYAMTKFPATVEGGVFGGIQAGSQLLLALALLLRAAGQFEMKTEIGYTKYFPLDQKPQEQKVADDAGFTYSIKGDINVGAYLDIVATALYFFRKQFSLELGKKSLGEFEFSNTKKEKPKMKDKSLADRDKLDKEIDPSVQEEAKSMSLDELLSYDFTKRFAEDEKRNVEAQFTKAEEARNEAYQQKKKDELSKSGKKIFNDVPLIDFQVYDGFMNDRCNWNGIHEVISKLGTLKTKEQIEALNKEGNKGQEYLENTYLPELEKLGKSMNMADKFVGHYRKKIDTFKDKYVKKYPGVSLGEFITLLDAKHAIFDYTNKVKRLVHSQREGDLAKQKQQADTSGWFFGLGSSQYEEFCTLFGEYTKAMEKQKETFEQVDVIKQQVGLKLLNEHRKSAENI